MDTPENESAEWESEEDSALENRAERHLRMLAANDSARQKLAARFRSEGEIGEAEKLENCNQPIRLRCSECQHTVAARTACRRRWCPVCARVLAARRVAKYEKAAGLMQWPMHVTLTIRNTFTLEISALKKLLLDFKQLRRSVLWSRSVKGGMVALELTNKGKGWHPHLHILCDAEWLAYKTPPMMRWHSKERKAELCQKASAELSALWAEIVGQEMSSVRVRRCAAALAVREVLKYAVKGTDMLEFKGRAADVVAAMKSARLFTVFGSLYGKRKELKEDPRPPCTCEGCGCAGTLIPEDVLERLAKSDSRRAPIDRRASR
jgi:hypothetical protein